MSRIEDNCCSKEDCSYPIVNKTHKLCQTHNWERNHNGENFFEHKQKKQNEYAKRMQDRAFEKAKKNPPKPYVWKPKKKPTPIKPVSSKMAKALDIYGKQKQVYIKENPECEAHFCNCATPSAELTIHHKMGRIGYASEEKRLLDIPLLLDNDYFMAACGSAHRWIEENVAQAKEWGYSLDRIVVRLDESQN